MVLLTVLCKLKWRARRERFPPRRSQTQCDASPPAGFCRDLSGGDVNHASAPGCLPAGWVGKGDASAAPSLGQTRRGSGKRRLAPSSHGKGGSGGGRRGVSGWALNVLLLPHLSRLPLKQGFSFRLCLSHREDP